MRACIYTHIQLHVFIYTLSYVINKNMCVRVCVRKARYPSVHRTVSCSPGTNITALLRLRCELLTLSLRSATRGRPRTAMQREGAHAQLSKRVRKTARSGARRQRSSTRTDGTPVPVPVGTWTPRRDPYACRRSGSLVTCTEKPNPWRSPEEERSNQPVV